MSLIAALGNGTMEYGIDYGECTQPYVTGTAQSRFSHVVTM